MVDTFRFELDRIHNETLRGFVRFALTKVHEDFWTMPASTSGKYHPAFSNVVGGLVAHTKVAVYFGRRFARCYYLLQDAEDVAIAALILHDMCKPEEREFYKSTTHSDLAVKRLDEIGGLFKDQVWFFPLKQLVYHHMGPWSPDKPEFSRFSPVEQVVHLGDYAAAQKHVRFEDIDNLNKGD